ncbi:hypothetical protein FOXYSP1_07169 [Fusarium oxysporum f. sp. phaseoli]
MPLASTEITWLLRYDVDHLWMSLHEAESRSFDRLQYDLIIGNWCSFSSSRFFQWSSHPNFVASGLRLSDLSVRDEVSPTCIGSNIAFSSQTLKHIYDALVLVRVSRKYIGPFESSQAVVATKKAHGASSTTAEEHVLQGKAERNGASIQVVGITALWRLECHHGNPRRWFGHSRRAEGQRAIFTRQPVIDTDATTGSWYSRAMEPYQRHKHATAQCHWVSQLPLISSVRTLNTIAYQAEAPSRLATHVTT